MPNYINIFTIDCNKYKGMDSIINQVLYSIITISRRVNKKVMVDKQKICLINQKIYNLLIKNKDFKKEISDVNNFNKNIILCGYITDIIFYLDKNKKDSSIDIGFISLNNVMFYLDQIPDIEYLKISFKHLF